MGLLLAPAALGVAATMPLGGWLADHIGAKVPVTVGAVVMGVSMWDLGHLGQTTSERHLVAILVVSGLGSGLAIMPSMVAAMNALPTRFIAQAAVVRSLNQRVAAALGTAALASYLAARLGVVAPTDLDAAGRADAQHAYNQVFLLMAAVLAVVAALATFLPGRARMRAFQAERATEHEEVLLSALDAT